MCVSNCLPEHAITKPTNRKFYKQIVFRFSCNLKGFIVKKEKRRLVVDGEDIYWLVDGKRLSKNKAVDLQKKIDDEFFNEKSET